MTTSFKNQLSTALNLKLPFVNARLLALTLPAYGLINFVRLREFFETRNYAANITKMITVLLTMILVALMSKKILEKKFKSNIPIKFIVALGLILSLVRIILIYGFYFHANFDDSLSYTKFFIEVVTDIVILPTILVTLGALTYLIDRDVQEKRKILAKNKALAQILIQEKTDLNLAKNSSRDVIIKQVVDRIQLMNELELLSEDPAKNWKLISEELRKNIANRVRNTSHELSSAFGKQPSIFSRNNFQDHRHKFTVYPVFFIPLNITGSLFSGVTHLDLHFFHSISILVNSLFIYVSLCFFSKKFLENKTLNITTLIKQILIFVLFLNFILGIFRELFFEDFQPLLILGGMLWHSFLLVTINAYGVAIDRQNANFTSLESINDDLKDKVRILRDYNVFITNEISKHLHGHLMSHIHKFAFEVDAMKTSLDFRPYPQLFSKWLEDFSLENFIQDLNRASIDSDFFSHTKSKWDGLVSIDFIGDLNFYQDFQSVQLLEISNLITELIGNAFRHGKAGHISIEFESLHDRDLKIIGRDNGVGIEVNFRGRPIDPVLGGIGFQIYNSASGSLWESRHRPFDALFAQQVQHGEGCAVGVVADVIRLSAIELKLRMKAGQLDHALPRMLLDHAVGHFKEIIEVQKVVKQGRVNQQRGVNLVGRRGDQQVQLTV